jgi:hypothetical protein
MAPACGLYLGHVKYEPLWIHDYREIAPSSETWYYLLWNAPIHELGIVRTIIYGISWIVQRDAGTSCKLNQPVRAAYFSWKQIMG